MGLNYTQGLWASMVVDVTRRDMAPEWWRWRRRYAWFSIANLLFAH